MKFFQRIIIWILILFVVGLIIKIIYEVPGIGVLVLFIIIGLMIGISRAILTFFSSKRKKDIFKEALTVFSGKINLNGETEMIIKGRKVLLDYKLENSGKSAHELVIANVDVTDIGKKMLEKCKDGFEILEKNNRLYAVIYCSWGNNGEKFRKRVEQKIELIDECND